MKHQLAELVAILPWQERCNVAACVSLLANLCSQGDPAAASQDRRQRPALIDQAITLIELL
jgi:hypothetical protein